MPVFLRITTAETTVLVDVNDGERDRRVMLVIEHDAIRRFLAAALQLTRKFQPFVCVFA